MLRLLFALIFFGQVASSDALVDVKTVAPSVIVDMRYASENNFLGQRLYTDSTCFVLPALAKRIAVAEQIVSRRGFHLVLWDCYRPVEYQHRMWNACVTQHGTAHCTGLVANPNVSASYHNSGAAIDVGLAGASGNLVELPSKFDSGLFPNDSPQDKRRARRPAQQSFTKPELWSEAGWQHFQVLEQVLLEAGLSGISSEWWHWSIPRSTFAS